MCEETKTDHDEVVECTVIGPYTGVRRAVRESFVCQGAGDIRHTGRLDALDARGPIPGALAIDLLVYKSTWCMINRVQTAMSVLMIPRTGFAQPTPPP
jgi:hypothetical protein